MLRQQIDSHIQLFVGETYQSNATIFINGEDVLLVECLGSVKDAQELKAFVEEELGKQVRFIISTHYFADHLAGLKCFPQAHIIAHRNYLHTFTTEKYRSEEEAAFFVEPTILVTDGMMMQWGRYSLEIFHNPSHTMGTLCIDVPEADLLIVGDTVVESIVYFSYSAPEMFFTALQRLQRRSRTRLISSHGGVKSGDTIDKALLYLSRLRERVLDLRKLPESNDLILNIPLESCLAEPGAGTATEEKYHQRNLESIVERNLFLLAA
jgi:cyclase